MTRAALLLALLCSCTPVQRAPQPVIVCCGGPVIVEAPRRTAPAKPTVTDKLDALQSNLDTLHKLSQPKAP